MLEQEIWIKSAFVLFGEPSAISKSCKKKELDVFSVEQPLRLFTCYGDLRKLFFL